MIHGIFIKSRSLSSLKFNFTYKVKDNHTFYFPKPEGNEVDSFDVL